MVLNCQSILTQVLDELLVLPLVLTLAHLQYHVLIALSLACFCSIGLILRILAQGAVPISAALFHDIYTLTTFYEVPVLNILCTSNHSLRHLALSIPVLEEATRLGVAHHLELLLDLLLLVHLLMHVDLVLHVWRHILRVLRGVRMLTCLSGSWVFCRLACGVAWSSLNLLVLVVLVFCYVFGLIAISEPVVKVISEFFQDIHAGSCSRSCRSVLAIVAKYIVVLASLPLILIAF